MSIGDFTQQIADIKQSPEYKAVVQIFHNNAYISQCSLATLEHYSGELDGIVKETKVAEVSAEYIDKINNSLVQVSSRYARVSELKTYFMRLHLEWKRHFPIVYAKFDTHGWIKTFRNKETRQAIVDQCFEDYALMADLTKFLIDKCDLILEQFRVFTFNLRDQRENLRLECQYFMSNSIKHPET